jgi:PAS domain-containing protein
MPAFVVRLSALAVLAGRRGSRAGAAPRQAHGARAGLLRRVEDERRRLETVLERLPAGVLIVDGPSSRIVLENAHAQRILGRVWGADADDHARRWKREDGTPFEPFEMPMLRALRDETVKAEAIVLDTTDGMPRALSVNAAPLHDASQRVAEAVVIFEDVSARKRAEQALRRSESELQTILANVDQGIVVADLDGRLVHGTGPRSRCTT